VDPVATLLQSVGSALPAVKGASGMVAAPVMYAPCNTKRSSKACLCGGLYMMPRPSSDAAKPQRLRA
jgi:hypothetical protein